MWLKWIEENALEVAAGWGSGYDARTSRGAIGEAWQSPGSSGWMVHGKAEDALWVRGLEFEFETDEWGGLRDHRLSWLEVRTKTLRVKVERRPGGWTSTSQVIHPPRHGEGEDLEAALLDVWEGEKKDRLF